MALVTYSDSGATTEASEFIVGDTVYLNGNILTSADTTDTTVKIEVFNSSDVLQATPLDTTYSFTANTDTTITTINSSVVESFDTTGYTAGEFYLKLTVSGTGVETTYDYEWFKVSAVPVISNQQLDDYAITTYETTTASCDVTNMTASDDVFVDINDGQYVAKMSTSDNAAYSLGIKGYDIGNGSSMTVRFTAANSAGGDTENAASTLTVSTGSESAIAITQLDYQHILLNYLRWKVSDPASRGSTATETFSGDGSTTTFTVANNGMEYVGTVTVDGITQRHGEHFTLDLKDENTAGTITFRTAPASGTNNISITYGYGTSWILPFRPTRVASMPMVGLKKISAGSTTLAAGNPGRWYTPIYEISVHVRRGNPYTISGKIYTGDELAAYISNLINNQLVEDGLGDIYQLLDCNQDDSSPLPYDFENKTVGLADTYSLRFTQRF